MRIEPKFEMVFDIVGFAIFGFLFVTQSKAVLYIKVLIALLGIYICYRCVKAEFKRPKYDTFSTLNIHFLKYQSVYVLCTGVLLLIDHFFLSK